MGRITIVMKTGLVWAIISFIVGCAQTQEWIYPKTESQNKKIEHLTVQLHEAQQAYLVLKKENRKLKADNLRLMSTNSRLKTDNRALTMKIDMLKILDHRVEEKRKSYSSD